MIRVGTVNIDTSHPMGFADAMAKDGRMRYVGVYNDSFRSDAEVEGFIKRYGLEKRCQSIEELAEMCDIGFIQGCNWDEHLRCAQPFIERGKPVMIDKPLVGSERDCRRVRELASQGAVILGSSSARYAYEIQELNRLPVEERGELVSVLGTAAQWVRYLGRGEAAGKYSESYYVQYAGGQSAIYNTFTGTWQPFVLSVMTTKRTYALQLDSNRLYEALMKQVADYMEGKANLLADTQALVESVEIMLAGLASRENGGKIVRLDELSEDGPAYDGEQFRKGYAAAAGPMYAL